VFVIIALHLPIIYQCLVRHAYYVKKSFQDAQTALSIIQLFAINVSQELILMDFSVPLAMFLAPVVTILLVFPAHQVQH
jgi:hypothetical protein